MTDRELVQQATTILTNGELDVWLAKHVTGHGRRTGAFMLNITEEAWRHRLASATRKLAQARKEQPA